MAALAVAGAAAIAQQPAPQAPPAGGRQGGAPRCTAGWTWTWSAACSVAPLPGRASGARHARPEDSRRPDGQGAGQSLGHCVPAERRHARHGKAGPASHRPQRHARPAADCRRPRGLPGRPGWTAGGPAASALRREPVSLSDVLEIARAHRSAGASRAPAAAQPAAAGQPAPPANAARGRRAKGRPCWPAGGSTARRSRTCASSSSPTTGTPGTRTTAASSRSAATACST